MTDTNSGAPESKDVEDNKVIAAIGYLWILCLVPLLGKKSSKFAQHHGKQGLVLTVVSIILWVVGFILVFIPIIGWLVLFVAWITLIVLAVMGIIKSLNGEMWEMPILGEYAKKIKL
jgi:uncharacterized membrane protein